MLCSNSCRVGSCFPNDISLADSKFSPESITEEVKKTNAVIENINTKGRKWHEVGIAKYREMQEAGETPLPGPVYHLF
ncbi:hypothetical protein jhhlp_008522 [Lomentospora prolificans]|uniref:Uncharacterized protein n=1 Tax=Lomentospora prolificans TaxID=41688 RepID=A0A2N3MYA7_9PEZI|nr:hypothetical protein jhhlp_008522 [Lomentospora prolificans]